MAGLRSDELDALRRVRRMVPAERYDCIAAEVARMQREREELRALAASIVERAEAEGGALIASSSPLSITTRERWEGVRLAAEALLQRMP